MDEKYSLSALSYYSDAQLIATLKRCWGYDENAPLIVIGRLRKRETKGGTTLYVLEDIRSAVDDRALVYPLDAPVLQNVFVRSERGDDLTNSTAKVGEWVSAQTELSPKSEREKFSNPFALRAINGDVQQLSHLPKSVKETEFTIDGEPFIDQRVFDYVLNRYNREILAAHEKTSRRLAQQQQAKVAEYDEQAQLLAQQQASQQAHILALSNTAETLAGKLGEQEQQFASQQVKLTNTKASLAAMSKQQQQAIETFNAQKLAMEQQLNKLNQFIESRAKMLVDLDIVEQADIDALVGQSKPHAEQPGHDFFDVFNGDVTQAVSYIQAFMHDKNIIYRRSVLADFFALVTTHDLIILAGDSGSGKTNLVKSFAEAVGGKAFIVPVKPNWTSAEDLLGYYNPLEQKYLTTPFVDALFEASRHPDIPYFICLDEMNLARVEYYFADFLSLLEERNVTPEIPLYSDSEASQLLSEVRTFLSLVNVAQEKVAKPDLVSFLDLLRDEALNAKLQELCGFGEGDSLLKYHARLRKMMSSFLNTPSTLKLPENVRIIGAINVDETTHYLSPKILDRVHIMRFSSPLLADWTAAEAEVAAFDLDLNLPLKLNIAALGERGPYPQFDRDDPLVAVLIRIARDFLEPLGVEFGLRTVRQARHYRNALNRFGADPALVLNNIVLHKVLPKLMFDGEKNVSDKLTRKDVLINLRDFLSQQLSHLAVANTESCIAELDRVIANAEANDWVVNYWSR